MIAGEVFLSAISISECLSQCIAHGPAEMLVKPFQRCCGVARQVTVVNAIVSRLIDFVTKGKKMLEPAHRKASVGFRFPPVLS
jgi:hypothetical protein